MSNENVIEKDLKIKAIDIQNIKNIDYINTTFSDWVVVEGENANWKTSLVDSIFLALKWPTLYWIGTEPVKIIKHWEKKAVISIIVKWKEKEFTVKRTFKKWNEKKPWWTQSFEAYFDDGTKISQKELSELINVLTIDPLKLDKMNIPDSIKEVQKITWLDTSEINQEIEKAEEERKFEKQWLIKINSLIDSYSESWIPEKAKKVNVNELLKVQEWFKKLSEKKQEFKSKKEKYLEIKDKVEKYEEELRLMKENRDKLKEDATIFKTDLKVEIQWFTEKNWTEEDNNTNLLNVQWINEKADKYEEYQKQINDRKTVEKWIEKCEDEVEKLRYKKLKMIKWSNMPDYMEVSETYGIMVDWTEYKQLNTARKIEVAIDLVLISWSPLRVLNIEEWWELDIKTLSKIQDKILEKWFQIFIQRAKIDEFNTIIVKQWEIIDDVLEKKELIEKSKKDEKEILNKLKK